MEFEKKALWCRLISHRFLSLEGTVTVNPVIVSSTRKFGCSQHQLFLPCSLKFESTKILTHPIHVSDDVEMSSKLWDDFSFCNISEGVEDDGRCVVVCLERGRRRALNYRGVGVWVYIICDFGGVVMRKGVVSIYRAGVVAAVAALQSVEQLYPKQSERMQQNSFSLFEKKKCHDLL